MPIDREQIPALIKAAQTKALDNWKKNYFEKVAKALQVHTKGQLFNKVDTLFPNEHPDSKAHCIATYEPITKASIWKGINNLQRIFAHSSFSYQVGDMLTDWLAEYEFNGMNLLNYFLQEWIAKAVAEDPNGLFVIYPPDWAEERGMCPIQWVRSDLIKSVSRDSIAFISEHDSEVDYTYESTVISRKVFEDPSVNALNAISCTEVSYNQRLKVKVVKEVVHLFTRDGFLIYTPQKKDQVDVTIVDFADPLNQIPAFPGGGTIADRADIPLFESFVQPFVPFGNLALIQHRNHRAVDLQFSYPRMSELQMPCDHKGCAGGKVKCPKTTAFPDGFMPCPKCKGNGFTTVQSPYKVYNPRYDPNDQNENKHLTVDPVKFYSPDVGIIDYSKDAWKDYLKQAETAIFVTQKVYTGQVQSAESKDIDLEDQYAWLLNPAKTFYNNLRFLLQALEDYMSRNPSNVSVERPFSFAILTEGEAFLAMDRILQSTAPVFIKGNQVENFVTKFVSKDSPVIRALAILKQFDTLLFYSANDVQTFKGANVISADMYKTHVLAYPVMLKLYQQDRDFFNQEDSAIIDQLTKEIAAYNVTTNADGLRASVMGALSQDGSNPLRNSVGGLTGMIEIVKAVASGVYSREAAAKLIADRFGLTEAEALEQLGNPTVTSTEEAQNVAILTK